MNCAEARADFVNNNNRDLWDSQIGFWSSSGCRLSRDKMPPECKDYDCRKYRYVIHRFMSCGKWTDAFNSELKSGEKTETVKI
jgi:hypothetical protein